MERRPDPHEHDPHEHDPHEHGPDRERLAATFDRAADLYDRARPAYPDTLVDGVVAACGLGPGSRVLEIGCATGVATRALARRGLSLTCLEPGAALAERAQATCAGLPVDVVTTRFEDWRGGPFDAVVAATSWHWVDPARRYRLAHAALRPGGHLAFWAATHVFPDDGDPFFAELQEVYAAIGEDPAPHRPRPGELPDQRAEVQAEGLFEVVDVRHVDWSTTYDAQGYLDLLDTFSGHIAMERGQREHLHGEIRRRLAARPDGLLRRHWGCVVHVARRVG